ncbi:MAG: SIMPL domain-containing protein [Chloroflexota bacterium]
MESKPDTIHISASHRQEVQATHADLFVTVRGSSVVSGNEAMKKAKEVNALVEEVVRFGIPAENVHLEGVRVETSSGPILKSSSAHYRLRIRSGNVEQVAGLLDIVGSQKNAALERVAWKYNEEEARARGLESAIAAAKVKAQKAASALGVKLLGVYAFSENTFDEEAPPMIRQQAMMKPVGRAPEAEPSLGMDIQHSKTIQVNVEVEYRVSGFS